MEFTDMYGEKWNIPSELTKREIDELIGSIQHTQHIYAKAGIKGISPRGMKTEKDVKDELHLLYEEKKAGGHGDRYNAILEAKIEFGKWVLGP